MTNTLISLYAPPGPACFHDREEWVGYLQAAQECKGSQPFRKRKFITRFNFCEDCTTEYSEVMSDAGRCNPSCLKTAVES
jgi:hypothetical protein